MWIYNECQKVIKKPSKQQFFASNLWGGCWYIKPAQESKQEKLRINTSGKYKNKYLLNYGYIKWWDMPTPEFDMTSTSSTYCRCQSAKPPSSQAALLSGDWCSWESPGSIGTLQNSIVKQIHSRKFWKQCLQHKVNQNDLHLNKPAFEPRCCKVVKRQICTIWRFLAKLQTRSPIPIFTFLLTIPPIICPLKSPIYTFWLASQEHISKCKQNPACTLAVLPGGLCTKDNGGITGVPCTKRAFRDNKSRMACPSCVERKCKEMQKYLKKHEQA